MQVQQERQKQQQQKDLDKNIETNLINTIKQIYEQKSGQNIHDIQQKLTNELLNNFKIIQLLFCYLKPISQMDKNFKNTCVALIKKIYYKISQNLSINKQPYISLAYELLVTSNYGESWNKQGIRIALQHIFNKDEKAEYRTKWKNITKVQYNLLVSHPDRWTIQTIQIIYGFLLILISYLNSLIIPQDQIIFVGQISQMLCKSIHLCSKFTKDTIKQDINKKLLYAAPLKIYQFYSLAIERIFDEQQEIQQQVQNFKNSLNLSSIISQYLIMFCNQHTIITNYQELNQIKVCILEILQRMSLHKWSINVQIVELLLITLIKQSMRDWDNDEQDEHEQIVSGCINVLKTEMSANKIDILFALLLYCRTSAQEQSYMVEQPQKFVDLAEEFTENVNTSSVMKIRAGNFIKILALHIDQVLVNITELGLIFITDALGALLNVQQPYQIQLIQLAKQVYKNYAFMQLHEKQKLEITFMVYSKLTDEIQKREDIKTIMTSMLITYFELLTKINYEIVILRLIRFIGYFPVSTYFPFIQNTMKYNQVFLLQGLCCFNRLCRNSEYIQIFPIMHLVYINLMQFIQITDPIFQRLVNQNYTTVLTKNSQLYQIVCSKIQKSYMEGIERLEVMKYKQQVIKCLNYVETMYKKENKNNFISIVKNLFFKMEAKGIGIQLLQDNFIGMYYMMIGEKIEIEQKIQKFIIYFSQPIKLHHYPQSTQYFQLLNKYIIKSDKLQIIKLIYNNLINYLYQYEKQKFNFAILPYVIHSIGHIVITNLGICIQENFVKFLVDIVLKKQKNNVYFNCNQCWYMFLLLHFIYRQASAMRELLLSVNKYYAFMIALFNSKFNSKIERKAAVLAIQQLLVYETDIQSKQEIIKFCMMVLNSQKQKYLVKIRYNQLQRIKQNNNNNNIIREEEQRMDNNDEQNYNIKYINIFDHYKHPFDKIDQFIMFKQRIIALINNCQISEKSLPGLSQILQYQWHKKFVRKVFKICK